MSGHDVKAFLRLIALAPTLIPWALRDRVGRTPGVRQLQRAIVARTLGGKEFAHRVDAGPAKGMVFHLRLPDDKGIWTGAYESHFASRLAGAVRPWSVAWDIGSWHGFFAGVMAAQGARQVHAFEPLPCNADRIRKLIALNPGSNIRLHPCAIADRDGETDLLLMGDTSMASLAMADAPVAAPQARLPTAVRCIDSLVASGEAEPPDLLKIDVEGAELLVLRGALATLRSRRPDVFAEIHSSALLAETSGLLLAAGYEVSSLDKDAGAARARDIFHIRAVAASGG